jgi:hypothetical protein
MWVKPSYIRAGQTCIYILSYNRFLGMPSVVKVVIVVHKNWVIRVSLYRYLAGLKEMYRNESR